MKIQFSIPLDNVFVIFILLGWNLEHIDYQLQPSHFTEVEIEA